MQKKLIIKMVIFVSIVFLLLYSCGMDPVKDISQDSDMVNYEKDNLMKCGEYFTIETDIDDIVQINSDFFISVKASDDVSKINFEYSDGVKSIYGGQYYIVIKTIDIGDQYVTVEVYLKDGSVHIKTIHFSTMYVLDYHWSFDNTVKESFHNQHGEIILSENTDSLYKEGKFGNAFVFGNHSYVKIPDINDNLDVGEKDFSIACWVKTNSDKSNNTIIDKRSNYNGYHLTLVNGRVLFQINDGTGFKNFWGGKEDPNIVNDGEWHLIIISVDRDNPYGLNIIIDGKITNTLNPTSKKRSLSNNIPLLVGKHRDNPDNDFDGLIDELRIIKRKMLHWEEIFNIHIYNFYE